MYFQENVVNVLRGKYTIPSLKGSYKRGLTIVCFAVCHNQGVPR